MPLDSYTKKIFEDSSQIQKYSETLETLTATQSEALEALHLRMEAVNELARKTRAAAEPSENSKWQLRFLLLPSHEKEQAQQVWSEMRNGVPGAPRRLQLLPYHVRLLILEALQAAAANGNTGDRLASAFE